MNTKLNNSFKKVKWLFGKEIEIPEEWRLLCIQDIAKINPEQIQNDYRFDEIDYIDISAIKNFQTTKLEKFQLYERPSRAQRIVRVDDVIISLVRPYLKAFSLISIDKSNIVCSTGFAVLRSKSACHPHFLFNYCQSHYFHENYFRQMEGMAYPAITSTVVSNSLMPIPPLPEQVQIASILGGVDACIESTQKVIEKTERLKRGLMQQLLTRGIGHIKFKKITFGRHFIDYKIPVDWQLSRLNIFATVHGRIGWKNLRSDEYVESGFLMLSVWSLVDILYGINFTQGIKRLSQFRYSESPEIQLQNGDVLVAKDGDIGRIGFVKKLPEPTTVNSHVVTVRVHDKSLKPEFLYWFFKSKPFQTYCKAFTSGTTVPLFTQKDLRNFIIPIPEIDEQTKIASILSGVDAYIQKNQEYKKKLERLKKGLMQKLLTGKIRVKI